MGRTYREFLEEKMKNPELKKEWDEMKPEFQLIRAMLRAREEQHLSQRQLSEITGMAIFYFMVDKQTFVRYN